MCVALILSTDNDLIIAGAIVGAISLVAAIFIIAYVAQRKRCSKSVNVSEKRPRDSLCVGCMSSLPCSDPA